MEFRLISCLDKVFEDGRGTDGAFAAPVALRGESVSFQIAIKNDDPAVRYGWLSAESVLAPHITLRSVESVAVKRCWAEGTYDENYISVVPGAYPDMLMDMAEGVIVLPRGIWKSVWVEIALPQDQPAGVYPVSVSLRGNAGVMAQAQTAVRVLDAALPEQTIAHTEWFHTDCLADWYGVPVFSQRYWQIVENYVRTAVRRGCTMLLTPHITPALDTRVGGERTTVQLVDVTVTEDGGYEFGFENLRRWIDMALRCGVRQLEMAHLFTQWGARHAPKVVGMKDGKLTRLFGWEDDAVGGEYTRFLHAYLPRLTQELRQMGVADRVCFHISDEPNSEQLADYKAAKRSVESLLSGFVIMDAMSDYEIFEESGIEQPVVSLHHMEGFLNRGISRLWGYTCCMPTTVMTNRFIQMPLARTRAVGMLLWRYQLSGFLHWGFNFYNAAESVMRINPFTDSESGGVYPAGDPFLVYPGQDGRPIESMRLLAMHQAMQDARALALLERLAGRERAMEALCAQGDVTFAQYPGTTAAFECVHERIYAAIEAAL